jgi:predicted MFS family arabinose efflux permease
MTTAIRGDGHSEKAWLASVALPAAASQTWFVALPPFLPAIADAIGVSPALAGQIVGLPVLLAAILIVFVGPLIDAFGHARVMTVGLVAIAASSLGTALATDAVALLAARLVGSFGRAGVIPAAFTDAVARPSQDQRRHGASLVIVGAASAPLIGVPALTLVSAYAGWRVAFVLVSILVALCAVLVWLVARGQPWSSTRLSLSALRTSLSEPAIATVLLASLVGNAGLWASLTYLGVLYATRLGLGAQDVGSALVAVGLGQLTCALAAMDRRVGRVSHHLLAACRVGVGLTFSLPYLVPLGATAIPPLLFAGGLALGPIGAMTPLLLSRQPGAAPGTVQSLNWLGLTAGIAAGASIGGVLLAAGDLPLVGFGALGLSCLAAILLMCHRPARLTSEALFHQS